MPEIVPQKFNPNKPAKIAQIQQDVADNLDIIFGNNPDNLAKAPCVCPKAKVENEILDNRLKLESTLSAPSADKFN